MIKIIKITANDATYVAGYINSQLKALVNKQFSVTVDHIAGIVTIKDDIIAYDAQSNLINNVASASDKTAIQNKLASFPVYQSVISEV